MSAYSLFFPKKLNATQNIGTPPSTRSHRRHHGSRASCHWHRGHAGLAATHGRKAARGRPSAGPGSSRREPALAPPTGTSGGASPTLAQRSPVDWTAQAGIAVSRSLIPTSTLDPTPALPAPPGAMRKAKAKLQMGDHVSKKKWILTSATLKPAEDRDITEEVSQTHEAMQVVLHVDGCLNKKRKWPLRNRAHCFTKDHYNNTVPVDEAQPAPT